jgi:hypothetical protein
MQPWANLVVSGKKTYETRSWSTSHRGLLYIHASKGMPDELQALCLQEPFRGALGIESEEDVRRLPYGGLLGIVELVDCWPIRPAGAFHQDYAAFRPGPDGTPPVVIDNEHDEHKFGDYRPGRWAWQLKVVERFEKPIPMPGRQGIWKVHPDLLPPMKPRTIMDLFPAPSVGPYGERR